MTQFRKLSASVLIRWLLTRLASPSFLSPAQLSEEQLYQLHEFMMAAREAYDPSKAQGQPPGTVPPPAPAPSGKE